MASSSTQTAKKDDKVASEKQPEQATQQKTTAALEEDDEFEDFPVDGMPPSQRPALTLHKMRACPLPSHTRSQLTRRLKTDWTVEETEAATGGAGGETTTHLWEESWDDDDTSDDFSTQLKYGPPRLAPVMHTHHGPR